MSGKHGRQFPRWNQAARFGVVVILFGSIGAGVLVAAREPRPVRALPVAAHPVAARSDTARSDAARRPARTAAVTSPTATPATSQAARPTAPAGSCTSPSPADR